MEICRIPLALAYPLPVSATSLIEEPTITGEIVDEESTDCYPFITAVVGGLVFRC